MKVCSVNLADGAPRVADDRIKRDVQNNLVQHLYKLCRQLPAPNEEFYRIFAQLKSANIAKTPQEKITMAPGGVVGDRHFSSSKIENINGKFYNTAAFNQVSILTKERYAELNKLHDKNIQAGEFGENIQTQGLVLNKLSHGTVLQFGDTAQIKICHLRTFCYKFAMVLKTADEYFNWRRTTVPALCVIKRIGVTGQVVKSGIVRPNDSIQVVYAPSAPVPLRYLNSEVEGVYSLEPRDPPTNT
jgi:MOSC domain-containing protein YiiM